MESVAVEDDDGHDDTGHDGEHGHTILGVHNL